MGKTSGSFTSETAIRTGRKKGAVNKRTTLRKVLVTEDIAKAREALREILDSKGHPDHYKASEMIYKLGVQGEFEANRQLGKRETKRMHDLRIAEIKARIIAQLQSIYASSPDVSADSLNDLVEEINSI
ncbi:hypothetical protein AB4383_08000 [Vibrio breoganii]